MTQWYENNHRRFREEKKALASSCPLMRLAVVGPRFRINSVIRLKRECAVAHGTYILKIPDSNRQIEYGIVLVLLDNFPKIPPIMFCNDPKLPIGEIDRHIMGDGRACIGVQAEIGMRWKTGSTIVDFLEKLAAPFLVWQVYFDAYKKPPTWGERSHFKQGIFEFYSELLTRAIDSTIVDFMRLLARKNLPKGHEYCPCGSREKLRNCHIDLVYNSRKRISWEDVKQDLAVLLNDKDIKSSNSKDF